MNTRTRNIIRKTEAAVATLVRECRKGGALYIQNPKVIAQVSRTGKWLLNAIASLHRELKTPCTDDTKKTEC